MMKYKVLSTKKLEPSLIEQAKQKNIEIIEQAAISIKTINTKEKWQEVYHYVEAGSQYVVFTSSHAVQVMKSFLHFYANPVSVQWKIFSLSGRTREAVEEHLNLFGEIIDTAQDAHSLTKKIIENKVKEVVFFCGNKRRDELPDALKKAKIVVNEVIVYNTTETPRQTTDDVDGVLFFSPSAVNSFFTVNSLKKSAICFAIGKTTAEWISQFSNNKTIISESPNQEGVLAAVIRIFHI
ncbi:MAG TPA: uroporphyrinogen-III synthase [Chitinophagaceae bacterium]|nr:uroporphyrinogen-III synthase [Chitinophagaceae bacterium]